MDPIATYVERHPQVKRTFKLYADRVEIDAQWLVKGGFHSTVELSSLKTAYREIKKRNRHYKTAKMVAGIGLVLIAIAVYTRTPGQSAMSMAMVAGSIILGAAITLIAMTYRKVIFVRFDNHQGQPGLDIAKIGPDRERFDEFVGLIQKQIREDRKRQ